MDVKVKEHSDEKVIKLLSKYYVNYFCQYVTEKNRRRISLILMDNAPMWATDMRGYG